MRTFLFMLGIVILLPMSARAQAQKPVSFINDVAPIFKEYCFACHDPKKRSGKLDMTTYEKIRAGGVNDDPITPEKPEDSELYTLMVTTEQRRMPPRDKGEAVPKEKAAIVARWIAEGAKLDDGIDPKADLLKELRVRWTPPLPPVKYQYPAIVNALAFTPDGKLLVAGGHHELTVWDVTEGKLVRRIHTRAERAYAMAFTPAGQLLVAGGRPGQEGDVRLYDILAGSPKNVNGLDLIDGIHDSKVMLKQLLDSDDAILSLAISADGKRVAAGGCDRVVRVWDTSAGVAAAKLEQTIENHADWILGLSLSPDGKYLMSASRDKTAKVWDLVAKESVSTFPEHQAPVFGVILRTDGKVGLSVGADKAIRAWNAIGDGKSAKVTGNHSDEIYRIVPHPKEPVVITCSADKSIRVWDANTLKPKVTMTGLKDFVYALAISPDGVLVAAGGYDGQISLFTLADGKLLRTFSASPGLSK